MAELLAYLSYGDSGWGDELLQGLLITLALALTTAPFALALSFLIAWAKHSKHRSIAWFGRGYTTVFRSLPELLTLLIIYYQLQELINAVGGLFGSQSSITLNAFFAGVVALTLVFSALGSEVVRAAYQAVGTAQQEAALALGLSRSVVFFKVLLPQMWRHAIPAFGNLWLILLKDTSLISIIAVSDLMRYTNMAIATTREPFFFYAVVALIYILLAFISGLGQRALERHTGQTFIAGR